MEGYKFRDVLGLLDRNPQDLTGKTAIIVGGGNGIGQAVCLLFARQGCTIGISDLNESGIQTTIDLIQEKYPHIKTVALPTDVTDHDKVKAMTDKFVAEVGKVDILVNTAGYSDPKSVEEMEPDNFERMIKVHLMGTYNWVRSVIPYMKNKQSGKIIGIGSTAGMTGGPKWSSYAAAKAGVGGFLKSVAKEYVGDGIITNIVAPGTIYTNLNKWRTEQDHIERGKIVPIGRQGETMEIAYLCLFLASPESDFIVGQTISPNGGEFIVGI